MEIERLNMLVSHDVDLKSNIFLKTFAAVLTPFIIDLINQSIKTEEHPIDIMKAIVIPLFKQRSITDVNIYWPISILPSLSKILEKLCSRNAVDF